jgi:hypothetical protein
VTALTAGRTIRAVIPDVITPQLQALPGLSEVDVRADRVSISSNDSDAALRALHHNFPQARESRSPRSASRTPSFPSPDKTMKDRQDEHGLPDPRSAQGDAQCRIVVCITFGGPGYPATAVAARVAGFVVKDTRAVGGRRPQGAQRLRVVHPSLAAESLATGHNPLTEQKRDVPRDGGRGRHHRGHRQGAAPVPRHRA